MLTDNQHKLHLGSKRHHPKAEASYYIAAIEDKESTDVLSTCCMLSQSQPAKYVFFKYVKLSLSTNYCSLRLSTDIVSFGVAKSYVPPHVLSDLLEQLSVLSKLHSLHLYDTSLASIKSLFLGNKVNTLSKLMLADVVMTKRLCNNLLRQIMFLNRLITFELSHTIKRYDHANAYKDLKSGQIFFCVIDKALCSEFLAALSVFNRLKHLDLSGNNLTGCLPNFIPHSYPGLTSLKRLILKNAGLNAGDLQHLANLIQLRKVPNLKELKLNHNDFHGIEDKVLYLINVGIMYHQTELKLRLCKTNLDGALIEKWQSQCEGTHIQINKLFYYDDEYPNESYYRTCYSHGIRKVICGHV